MNKWRFLIVFVGILVFSACDSGFLGNPSSKYDFFIKMKVDGEWFMVENEEPDLFYWTNQNGVVSSFTGVDNEVFTVGIISYSHYFTDLGIDSLKYMDIGFDTQEKFYALIVMQNGNYNLTSLNNFDQSASEFNINEIRPIGHFDGNDKEVYQMEGDFKCRVLDKNTTDSLDVMGTFSVIVNRKY